MSSEDTEGMDSEVEIIEQFYFFLSKLNEYVKNTTLSLLFDE